MPIWTESADDDLNDIVRYIAQDSIEQALKVEDVLVSNANLLDNMPFLGKSGRISGTNELVALPNYIIIYRVENGVPKILRIKHAALKN